MISKKQSQTYGLFAALFVLPLFAALMTVMVIVASNFFLGARLRQPASGLDVLFILIEMVVIIPISFLIPFVFFLVLAQRFVSKQKLRLWLELDSRRFQVPGLTPLVSRLYDKILVPIEAMTLDYKALISEIRKIMNEHDLEGLIAAEAPQDEYDPETNLIASALNVLDTQGKLNPRTLHEAIEEIWKTEFSKVPEQDLALLVEELLACWRKAKGHEFL